MPVPQVDSAVVSLSLRSPGEIANCNSARFEKLVKQGFSQRRKQLRKLIGSEFSDWEEATSTVGVPQTVRGEELSLDQWIAFINLARGESGTPLAGKSSEELAPHAQDIHGEVFDVVNDVDVVTATASRHEVHRDKLRHRAVHIFVFNQRGELFLQRRSQWKDMHPRRWDSSAAGHVNSGSGYAETAEREIVEELGVSSPVEEIGQIRACEGTGWEFVRLYRTTHEGPFILHPAEIETGEWFTIDQIERWIAVRPQDFATGFLECWRVFKNSGS
jgi:16S rRNA (adenine1518-N6/adenine1519-N6)-dimethyltransferase